MGLFKPQRDRDYFAAAARWPLGLEASERVRAWWLAEASLLAYVPEFDFVHAQWTRAGYAHERIERNETVCDLLHGNGETLVVFRGTAIDSVENYKTDLRVLLVPEGPGRVHQGFRDALNLVWGDVAARIGDERCWFAGHSLGAALATLAAARHGGADGVFTYGAPRPGDAAYRDAYTPPLLRYVNRDDIVTQLPPPLGYRHVGALRYFDGSGVLHAEPGLRTRAADVAGRWLSGELPRLPREALLDHAPIRYADLCLENVAPGD